MDSPNQKLVGAATLKVLNLDDDLNDSALIQAELKKVWNSLQFLRVDTRESFIAALDEFKPDVVLCDFALHDFDGRSALNLVRKSRPDIPVVMVAGALGDIEAVALVKAGAKDYVMKEDLRRLAAAVQGALTLEQGIHARKFAEAQIKNNEEVFRTLIENSPVAILVNTNTGLSSTVLLLNKHFTELFGYTLEDIPDQHQWLELAYPDEKYRAELLVQWYAQHEAGSKIPLESTVTCKDGSHRYVRVSSASFSNKNIFTYEDLTARKLAEDKNLRLSKLYATLSQCNEHIMRSENPAELFSLVCRDTVLLGGLKMAWVGLLEEPSLTIKPIASFGNGAQYLEDIQISADAHSAYGQGPTGRSVRENTAFWCQDFQHDSMTEPWHERGAKFGWGGSASIPLQKNGRPVGSMTFYAAEVDMFDEAVRNLLLEMVTNMSFALGKMDSDAKRMLQQQELLTTKNALLGTLDAIPDLLFDVNLAGKYFNVHAPRSSMLLAPSIEIIGKNISDFLPPEALKICTTALHEAEQNSWSSGKQYFLPDLNEGKWFELSIAKRPKEEGVESRFIVLARDITERKQEEENLRKLLQAVEQSSNAIVITDLNSKIEYANPAFTRASGYDLKEVIGANPRILRSGKTPPETFTEMWRELTHGNIWHGEFINKRKDGSEYTEAAQISPVRQPSGEITHYLAIKEDITQSKAMQESIKRNARRMEALLKLNELGGVLPEKEFLQMGLTLAENLTRSKISFIHFVSEDENSTELVTWSSRTLQNACAANDNKLCPVSEASIWADCLRNRRTMIFNDYAGSAANHDLPEGDDTLLRLMSAPIIEEGKIKIILGLGNKEENYSEEDAEVAQLIGNDLWRIARRVRLENELKINLKHERELNIKLSAARTQLLQSEKMASIGILSAGVAHEINNPVGFVNSNLGTLEKYVADIFTFMNKGDELFYLLNLPNQEVDELHELKKKLDIDFIKEDIKSLLKESREGLDRVKKIVLDLKNFSRAEADENWQLADIHQGIESTLTIVWNELKYKCEVRKDYAELPKIYCLPSQLNQVFMNLLVNAAQSIEKRGVITIRTGSEKDIVWIEFTDTGSGIPEDILPKIFDPFFTTKPVGTGTGLGLPVSYGIIERHQGKLTVSSEVDKGSTFRIVLPVKPSAIVEK